MSNISILGVVIGSVTDIVSSAILGVILMSGAVPPDPNLAPEQYQHLIETAMLNDPKLFISQFIVGGVCSIFGGYLAARIAKSNELLNGGLASFLCVGNGIYTLLAGSSTLPIWLILLSIVVSPVFAITGGYLRLRFKNFPQGA